MADFRRSRPLGAAHLRRRLAVDAASEVARRFGIPSDSPTILRDSNNTIVHLLPSGVVAKVGTSHFRDTKLESLEREVAVVKYLAERGAPVVPPLRDVPPGPHRWRGVTLTLWPYVESRPHSSPHAQEVAASLRAIHEAFVGFPHPLPSFTNELEDVRMLLDSHRSPALSPGDRRYLLQVVDDVEEAVQSIDAVNGPLHGCPHEGNWLSTSEGPVVVDFETACTGPVEWDLAALDDATITLFPEADLELITLLKRMRSACVAAKCWVEPDRAPEVLEAAQVHLQILRGEPLELFG